MMRSSGASFGMRFRLPDNGCCAKVRRAKKHATAVARSQ